MNICSVHPPMPVIRSGVMFAAYDTPHGPAHAVSVGLPETAQGLLGATVGGAGIFICSGCPASSSVVSSSGPCGPIFLVVWQSWQPLMVTRYLPRSTCDEAAAGAEARVVDCCAAATITEAHTSTMDETRTGIRRDMSELLLDDDKWQAH